MHFESYWGNCFWRALTWFSEAPEQCFDEKDWPRKEKATWDLTWRKQQPERAIMWKVQEDEADLNTGHQSREELCQKKSWNFVSIDREMPPWRAAVVFSKIVLKLIENCTWKREETNVLKVKSERKPAEKKLLKIAIAEQRRQKSSFWNIETSYCFYLATFSVPKWKRATEPTKSSHGRRIS